MPFGAGRGSPSGAAVCFIRLTLPEASQLNAGASCRRLILRNVPSVYHALGSPLIVLARRGRLAGVWRLQELAMLVAPTPAKKGGGPFETHLRIRMIAIEVQS